MAHPQHPHCPGCSKALFKSPVAAKVKPADPYAYCRNKACEQYTFRTLGASFDPKKGAKVKGAIAQALKVGAKKKGAGQTAGYADLINQPVVAHPETGIPVPADTRPAPPKPVSKRGRARAALPASAVSPKPIEPEPIAKARRRIKDILAEVVKGHPREAAGLVLAILSQETGNQRAAEALIDEYKLDTKFGLQKFQDHHR